MTIGERLKNLINTSDYSRTEIALKADISKQTLYKYENGIVTNIPSDKIELLSKILNTSPSYLMGWDEEEINAISQVQADANAYDDELESALISLTEQIKVSNLTLPQLTTLKTIVENIKILDLTEEELSEVYKYAQFLISRRS